MFPRDSVFRPGAGIPSCRSRAVILQDVYVLDLRRGLPFQASCVREYGAFHAHDAAFPECGLFPHPIGKEWRENRRKPAGA